MASGFKDKLSQPLDGMWRVAMEGFVENASNFGKHCCDLRRQDIGDGLGGCGFSKSGWGWLGEGGLGICLWSARRGIFFVGLLRRVERVCNRCTVVGLVINRG